MRPISVKTGVVIVALTLCVASVAVADRQTAKAMLPKIYASETTAYMYDTSGRQRIFHGGNFVQKGFPWYPSVLLNTTYVAELASYGFTAIRLGWMWSGFMPTSTTFNDTYFEITQTIVENLAAEGMYTLLDMHQDALSSKFCLYDGIPLWVIDKCIGDSLFPFPWPFTGNCSSRAWGANELTEQETVCYQGLYDNKHGMRDDLVRFWTESARRWAGNTNIIGYEIINEPFAGAVYRDPLLFLPGEAASKNLQPLYETIAQGIRSVDTETLIFYEPVTWGMVLGGRYGSGFTAVPGGDAYRNRSVLSYHYYCNSFQLVKGKVYPVLCDDVTTPLVYHSVMDDIAQIGGSSMLTEYGGCDTQTYQEECERSLTYADRFFQSWLEWDQWPTPNAQLVLSVTRTHARAIAGAPLNMTFDRSSGHFELCYTIDTTLASSATQVYASLAHHYGGVPPAVSATPNVLLAPDWSHNLLHITPTSPTAHNQTACVRLSRQ